MARLEFALPPFWKDAVRQYLRDDCPHFDVQGYGTCGHHPPALARQTCRPASGAVVGGGEETAVLLAKTATVIAGKPFFTAVFEELGCSVEWCVDEGADLSSVPFKAAYVRGPCRNVLLGERTALNILARASGIATAARELVGLARAAGWHGEVAGTRKTTPGFRLVEKYALLVGGASTHRMDLSSMCMLKDNHIWASGGITQAVKEARKVGGFSIKIEVECRSLDEALEAVRDCSSSRARGAP